MALVKAMRGPGVEVSRVIGEPEALRALGEAHGNLASANADFDIALRNYNAAPSAADKGRCSIAFSMAQLNLQAVTGRIEVVDPAELGP